MATREELVAVVTATLAALERCQRALADAADEDRAFVLGHLRQLEVLAARQDAGRRAQQALPAARGHRREHPATGARPAGNRTRRPARAGPEDGPTAAR